MAMDQRLLAFFNEIEKLGVGKTLSHFTQLRGGRRPISVGTLLQKETAYLPNSSQAEKNQDAEKAEDLEVEGGAGFAEKMAAAKERREKAIGAAATARPWIKSGIKGAIPAAVAANFLIPATEQPWLRRKSKAVAATTLIGAGLGVADKALQDWAARHKRTSLGKEILKTSEAEYEVPRHQLLIRKVASLAGDLRMKGLGGVKRPPFPTEDSKRFASNLIDRAKKPGDFSGYSKPKTLLKPGPSISSVATMPNG
jgi:hypothetical protein